jgi:hypothetical protein
LGPFAVHLASVAAKGDAAGRHGRTTFIIAV